MARIKRWAALCLALALILSLGGCRRKKSAPEPTMAVLTEVTPGAKPTARPTAEPAAKPTAAPTPEARPEEDPKGNAESLADHDNAAVLDEDGTYDSKEDVALYLHLYGQLPDNYMTKDEAEDLGWTGGSLERYAPGMCIGGDRFGNYGGQLPKANGRTWSECDIDTLGERNRGAKRIVYSNDGLIYYTDDHYESFELLYDDR